MERFSVLVCLIILAGCSKSEVLTPLDDLSSPASSAVVSLSLVSIGVLCRCFILIGE